MSETKKVEIEAFSMEHAKKVASGLYGFPLLNVIRVELGKKRPYQAKTCKTEDYPVTGTRHWITIYEVYAYGVRIPIGRNKFEYTNMELVQSDIKTKTEALKIAKEMAVKHQMPMTIQITQKLDSHPPSCADIEPKSTAGRYIVYYLAV